MDTWGSSKTTLLGRLYWFISFMDNYSLRAWVYPKHHKLDILMCFLIEKDNHNLLAER